MLYTSICFLFLFDKNLVIIIVRCHTLVNLRRCTCIEVITWVTLYGIHLKPSLFNRMGNREDLWMNKECLENQPDWIPQVRIKSSKSMVHYIVASVHLGWVPIHCKRREKKRRRGTIVFSHLVSVRVGELFRTPRDERSCEDLP